MARLIRKVKLHVNVQFHEDDNSTHLIAVSNLRLDATQPGRICLMFDTEPSLRTARKQKAMHRRAHLWAQGPETLRSIEMPAVVEDLQDSLDGKREDAEWYLRIEMPGYGSYSYRVRPFFEASIVTFRVDDCVSE